MLPDSRDLEWTGRALSVNGYDGELEQPYLSDLRIQNDPHAAAQRQWASNDPVRAVPTARPPKI